MKIGRKIIGIVFAIFCSLSLSGCIYEDYSGTYYVNLASQPRWVMNINQSGGNVTFTIDGDFFFEGEGTVYDNTMTLAADIDGTINIFITFSDDGQSFTGTWDHTSSGGTITGSKSPWVTYDVDTEGIPEFVTEDVMDLNNISKISKFRSGAGHDFSDDFESCRSMKHYFIPASGVLKSSIEIRSPISGTVIGTTDEWEGSDWKGIMVSIASEDYPAFHITIFHIDSPSALNVGDEIIAGQVLGNPVDNDSVTITDTAVGLNTPDGYKLVSYFDVMPDYLFQGYQGQYINEREDLIFSEVDADLLTCNGEQFINGDDLVNWVPLD